MYVGFIDKCISNGYLLLGYWLNVANFEIKLLQYFEINLLQF